MKYLGKGDSPESIVTKQELEETISEKIAEARYIHPAAHPISFITGLQAALDAKAPTQHSHTIANIENLQNTLNAKAATSHTHGIANITNLQTTLDGKANASHTHAIADTTGLQAALNGKASASHVHTIANITNLQTALDGKSDVSHSHEIENVANLQTALDGKVDDSQVLTNVPSNAKFTDTITTINGKTGAISKADIVALGVPAQDTNTTYSEITTTEIDTGTDSTLRTITARRLKYLLDKIVALFPTKTSELTNDSGFLTGVSKADVGLGSVDNTSDLNKPISTATQAALSGKVNNSRVLTDVPLNAKFTDTVYTHPTTHSIAEVSGLQGALDGKVDNSQVLTNVPAGAKFTDTTTTINGKTGAITKADIVALGIPSTDTNTITTINGKTGTILKADIVALGIPAQDTVVDISGKADKTYVDNKVKTDVPVGAKFTDTVYSHPASHPASMITGLPTSLPANGGNADTVGGFTVGVSVPANAKFTDTVYSHPTTAGNKHIPTGGASGQVLKYSASGTATWQADNDTITTINGKTGAISKADITALGIPAQDTVYIHPTTHSISEVSGLQTALDGKANISHSHSIDSVTGLQTALNTKADKTELAAKQSKILTVTAPPTDVSLYQEGDVILVI